MNMNPLESAYYLQGYFDGLEISTHAQKALDTIIEELSNGQRRVDLTMNDDLKDNSKKDRIACNAGNIGTIKGKIFGESDETDYQTGDVMLHTPPPKNNTDEGECIEKTTKKERKPWSDEARAAARQRAIDRGLGKKVKKGQVGAKLDTAPIADNQFEEVDEDESLPAKQIYKPISSEDIIEKHDEYIGEREDGLGLKDEDWPDVQRMLKKGATKSHVAKIARHYRVSPKEMENFIDLKVLGKRYAAS